ncbi:23S rRNA (uracil-5-)-methyltransferase rumA [Neisseria gonorrhoeae DGI2]|nr:23S rRNA (uracil-5-)-methyltransferase rumA [Neisseria gonorrhoeae NCCP11945]APW53669.1 23S rRNA methyltransferase [Neisseria gonorrhoeae NG-k51.05]EFE04799.1 23S rRNA (uracil-5-)-methyltransferase rumA [Neisseria gonorrhoeae DGI2]
MCENMRFGTVRTDWVMATETNIAEISALDYEGRGVAKVGGKTIFIKGALLDCLMLGCFRL